MAKYVVNRPDGLRVIYFPYDPAPGGIAPNDGSETGAAFVYTQTIPATTWTIQHDLGYNPSVALMIGGEEADADVDYPSMSVVVVIFGAPQAGTARLT